MISDFLAPRVNGCEWMLCDKVALGVGQRVVAKRRLIVPVALAVTVVGAVASGIAGGCTNTTKQIDAAVVDAGHDAHAIDAAHDAPRDAGLDGPLG